MHRLAVVVAVAALACKSSAPKGAPPPPPATDGGSVVVDDAAAAPPEGPDEPAISDEPALRAGKRTGLGAADERPEVAVEDFVQALLAGTQPWSRVVDPATGVVELRTLDEAGQPAAAAMGRRCGADADAALARLAKLSTAALAQTAQGYRLSCDNGGLADTPSVALCSIDADDEDNGLGFDLVFLTDGARGLRLAGVTALSPTPPPTEIADAFDVELGSTGRCP